MSDVNGVIITHNVASGSDAHGFCLQSQFNIVSENVAYNCTGEEGRGNGNNNGAGFTQESPNTGAANQFRNNWAIGCRLGLALDTNDNYVLGGGSINCSDAKDGNAEGLHVVGSNNRIDDYVIRNTIHAVYFLPTKAASNNVFNNLRCIWDTTPTAWAAIQILYANASNNVFNYPTFTGYTVNPPIWDIGTNTQFNGYNMAYNASITWGGSLTTPATPFNFVDNNFTSNTGPAVRLNMGTYQVATINLALPQNYTEDCRWKIGLLANTTADVKVSLTGGVNSTMTSKLYTGYNALSIGTTEICLENTVRFYGSYVGIQIASQGTAIDLTVIPYEFTAYPVGTPN